MITPDGKAIGIVFPNDTPLSLIVTPNINYSVGIDYSPTPDDLAWIVFSDSSGFLDCVVVSKNRSISFANAEIVNLLRQNDKAGRKFLESLSEELFQFLKDE